MPSDPEVEGAAARGTPVKAPSVPVTTVGGLGAPVEAPHVQWSAAVAIEQHDGRLWVLVPPQLAQQLAVGEGDVICYTAFQNGTVEVWSVRKNPYETLDLPSR